MNKKLLTVLMAGMIVCPVLGGCGGGKEVTYADGTYEAQSSVFENDDGSDDGTDLVLRPFVEAAPPEWASRTLRDSRSWQT